MGGNNKKKKGNRSSSSMKQRPPARTKTAQSAAGSSGASPDIALSPAPASAITITEIPPSSAERPSERAIQPEVVIIESKATQPQVNADESETLVPSCTSPVAPGDLSEPLLTKTNSGNGGTDSGNKCCACCTIC
mmetsp:Transcript_15841/g.26752  ORF Transcript_15841/g.26752 Transcript_15841/m.26752 type:complete len:135 (+) Transcript_15841:241-645(+)